MANPDIKIGRRDFLIFGASTVAGAAAGGATNLLVENGPRAEQSDAINAVKQDIATLQTNVSDQKDLNDTLVGAHNMQKDQINALDETNNRQSTAIESLNQAANDLGTRNAELTTSLETTNQTVNDQGNKIAALEKQGVDQSDTLDNVSKAISDHSIKIEELQKKVAAGGTIGTQAQEAAPTANSESGPSWTDGKYQTFPRQVMVLTENPFTREKLNQTLEIPVLQKIDIGTLGPDVDTICGIDFEGDIPTGALVIHQPSGNVKETRVVFIKRSGGDNPETVQLQPALGGDRFDVYRMSEHGGDKALDEMAKKHAKNTAREHQKVIYIGDLGLFEKQWGDKEKTFLNAIIRAQRPAKPEIGIQEPDFVNSRVY